MERRAGIIEGTTMPSLIDPKKEPESAPALTPAATAAGMSAALEDRSKYIRTMAKDMASLAGNPPAAAAPKPQPVREETVEGVTLKVEEQPFFEKPQARAERIPEAIALPPLQEIAKNVAPTPDPVAIRAAERAAVLERLREKVGESAQMSIQQSPAPAVPEPVVPAPEKSWPDLPAPTNVLAEPVPVVPELRSIPVPETFEEKKSAAPWSNIPTPAPQFAPLSEPVPSRLPPVTKESYREPIDAYVPPRPIAPATPEPLHTYTSDFSDRIDAKGASTFSVLAAEQDTRTKAAPALKEPKESPKKMIIAVATGVLLLLLAAGGIFATYQFVMTMRDTPIAALTVPSVVFADEYRELSGTGYELMSALALSANGPLVPGNVLVTYVLASATDGNGSVLATPAGGDVFMRALGVPAPDILLRNIAPESTIGVVNAGDSTHAFFALRVESYERTYAGMLTWEPLMARDLALVYPLYAVSSTVEEPVATSTATSTAASTTPSSVFFSEAPARTRFEDAIVANRDVRILRDVQNRSLILYGYADKRTLIIARDEAAFEALIARLKSE